MLTSTLLLALLPVAFAQYGDGGASPPTVATTAPAAAAAAPSTTAAAAPAPSVHTVTVGNGTLAFNPDTITANVGDLVEFIFFGEAEGFSNLTHSVVQADFTAPCVPSSGGTGIFSGGFMTTGTGPNANVFVVSINDTNPIWFFCGFPLHCGLGMVGVINPPAGSTIAQFQTAAMGLNTTAPTFGVQGGVVESPASVSIASTAPSSTASSSSSSAFAAPTGSVQWNLLGLTGAMAVGVGGLII